MATIVNNPPPANNNDSGFGSGLIIGILILLIVAFCIYWFGFRPSYAPTSPSNINVVVSGNQNQPTASPYSPSVQSSSTTSVNSTTTTVH